MIDALALKYESEIAEAEATLLVYFSNPVGIGEHPQHLEEMDKYVEKMANAKDKIETLKEFVFSKSQSIEVKAIFVFPR